MLGHTAIYALSQFVGTIRPSRPLFWNHADLLESRSCRAAAHPKSNAIKCLEVLSCSKPLFLKFQYTLRLDSWSAVSRTKWLLSRAPNTKFLVRISDQSNQSFHPYRINELVPDCPERMFEDALTCSSAGHSKPLYGQIRIQNVSRISRRTRMRRALKRV